MTIRETSVTRDDKHRIALDLLRYDLRSIERSEVKAWWFPADPSAPDDEVYVSERDPNHYNNFRHSATYDADALQSIVADVDDEQVRAMPEWLRTRLDDAVREEFEPGERARASVLPANVFGDLDSHRGACGEYPLINYNQAADLLSAEVQERIDDADDERVETALSALFQDLFPAYQRTVPGEGSPPDWVGLGCEGCQDATEDADAE